MTTTKEEKVDVEFGSHPPIKDDHDGIVALLRQTLLHYADCNLLAQYLIGLKDITQVIALEHPEGDDDSDDEADNDIYGVSSLIDLANLGENDGDQSTTRKQLLKFLEDKCSELKKLREPTENRAKICLVINERYINLPPQLSLPTLKDLTKHLDKSDYTHLVLVSKILLRARSADTSLPSKKSKSSAEAQESESIIYINAEEEIINENCEFTCDLDVSAHCDENATWSSKSDVKYIPHRRIMVINMKKWPEVLKEMEKELS